MARHHACWEELREAVRSVLKPRSRLLLARMHSLQPTRDELECSLLWGMQP